MEIKKDINIIFDFATNNQVIFIASLKRKTSRLTYKKKIAEKWNLYIFLRNW